MIFVFSLVMPYRQAQAAGFADIPGYADETFKAILGGAVVIGGAAAQSAMYVEDNLRMLVDTAGLTYDKLAPEAKQLFMDGLSATGDGISVAGDWITNYLDSVGEYYSSAPLTGVRNAIAYADTLVINTFDTDFYFTRGASQTPSNSLRFGANLEYVSRAGFYKVSLLGGFSGTATNISTSREFYSRDYESGGAKAAAEALYNQYKTMVENATFASAVATLNAEMGLGIDIGTVPREQMYEPLDRWLRDRASSNDLRLGVAPNTLVEPWANTGTGAQRAYWDESLGEWTLPDGVPIPRDQLQFKARGQGLYGDVPVVVGADGALYDLRTGDRVASREDAQVGGIPIPRTVEEEWAFQDTLTKNPAKEETKEETKPADLSGFFAKLWEWLKKILDAILAIPKAIIDALKALLLLLFIPADGFWEDNFNNVRLALTEKLGVDQLLDNVDQLGGASGGTFSDITVSLLGVSGLTVIDADSVNSVLEHIHKWVRGVVFPFLLFYNINQLYKLVRGTSLVEATRNLNRMKGE